MELSRTVGITTDYKDKQQPLAWDAHLFAEVVLIDKTSHSLEPNIFQLKDNALFLAQTERLRKPSSLSFPSDSFILLGQAASFDKKRKQILLADKRIIFYHYLIIASSSRPTQPSVTQEFGPGLHVLMEALRFKHSLPLPSTLRENNVLVHVGSSLTPLCSVSQEETHAITVQPYFSRALGSRAEKGLQTSRLYEIQI